MSMMTPRQRRRPWRDEARTTGARSLPARPRDAALGAAPCPSLPHPPSQKRPSALKKATRSSMLRSRWDWSRAGTGVMGRPPTWVEGRGRGSQRLRWGRDVDR
jgi:hypothetical protein